MAEPDVHEKIGALRETAKAAHSRLDDLERGIREDLKELTKKLSEIEAWMHRTKGQASVMIGIGTLLGAVISAVVSHYWK
jgi:tetrahydromethanopterin S-methyltransferase subunit G